MLIAEPEIREKGLDRRQIFDPPGGGLLHPHDGAVLDVLAPDLGRVVSDHQEVLGVEGVPLHCHHLAAVALEKNLSLKYTSFAASWHKDENECEKTSPESLPGSGSLSLPWPASCSSPPFPGHFMVFGDQHMNST